MSKKDTDIANKLKLGKAISLAESKNWYKDKYQTVVVQRNLLLVVTLLSLFAVVVLGLGLAALSDSKIFEPFVVEVDNKTGIVSHVDSKSIVKLTANDAVVRSLLVQYLRARESYSYYTYYQKYHNFVRLLSSGNTYRDFRFAIAPSREDSPINLQEKGERTVGIVSLTFLEKNTVQIRFVVTERNLEKGSIKSQTNYISTIKFNFSPNKSMTQQESYLNPLGFEVGGYTRELEYIK